MDISIREHIINNFKEDSEESIYDAIDESVKNGEEVTLPGLGVFMSIIWENSSSAFLGSIKRYCLSKLF